MKKVLLGLVMAGAVVLGGCSACPCAKPAPCDKCVMDSQQICSECDDYMLPIPNVTEL